MWAVRVALAVCLLAPSGAYFFESGFSHHYTYSAENSLFDQHNVTTVLKFQISGVNETEEGHRLHSLTVDSLVQYVKGGVLMNNPKQWDLSKTFLFSSDDRGSVRLVHCHPEDHEELVVIKKAMVSVFSVHVQMEEDEQKWTYSVHEQDHLGSLPHDYAAEHTDSGLKLHRKHFSVNEAFRTHEKVLQYDRHGTLHTADAIDHVMLKDRSLKRKPSKLSGEKPHKVTVSGEFPDIASGATVKVTLEGKRQKRETQKVFHNLTVQTLQTEQKPEPTYDFESVKPNITRAFRCLGRFPEKDNENRSICINDIRNILRHLHKIDYTKFVSGILDNHCQENGTVCHEKRLVLIDVVTRLGDVTSQELIVTHVLSRDPPVDEELRRVFMHCAAMEHPIESFIRAVEMFCVGRSGQHHGSRAMTRTQSRACLAVGSLVRHCHHAGHSHTATRLLDRLESWLEEHGKGDPHISKRDTWLEETEHEDHHISKAILLHALGNAAMSRSRRHLMLHATPNRGHQMWRRAALDALRKYNCTETAKVMLECLMHDEKHTVRRMALSVYVNHPRRHEVVKDHENIFLSKNYTYPAVARVKRNMFEDVLFKLKLELPKVDWKKELGTEAVGASFGLLFENGVDALFRVLNGYVDVNVHDKVFAEVHLGLIDKQWTILLAEVCYKGRLSYNMNIVKDFSVGMMEDISSAFDHIANRIIEPMEKAANDLASKYQDNNTNKPKSGFEPMANAVKELPKKTKRSLQSTVDLSHVTDRLSGMPVVTILKQLASRAQSLMEDVNTEATDLFTNIKDAAVVALPFAEKEVRKSLNTVLDKLGGVSEHPRQVFSFIERAKMGYQLAMQRIVQGNNIIKQATSFLSGSKSSFMNSGQELLEIAETTKKLVNRLRADHVRRRRQANPFGDIGEYVDAGVDMAVEDIKTRADEMAKQLHETSGSAKELQEGFDQQALYVEILKTSYQSFKEGIDMVKSRISALFGQKFHPKFPDQRRDCDSKCKCGYYPTDCKRYGHPGVDLKWDQGWKIPSPVAGLAKPAGDNSITIKPATAGFTDYVIILSNIQLLVKIDDSGTFVDAGQVIGEPADKNGCEDSHFHLAMKRNAPESAGGLCYYVDPSPFLDRMQPVPKWHQECKDFTFKHIGDVVDFSKLTEGFAKILQQLKRFAIDAGKRLLMKAVDALPDNAFTGAIKSIASQVIKSIDLDPANLKNVFKDIGGNMKSFFNNISTNKFNLNGIMKMAKLPGLGQGTASLVGVLNKVTGYVGKVRKWIKNPPLGQLASLATGAIGRVLGSRGGLSGQGCSGSGKGSGIFDSLLQSGEDKLQSLMGQATGGIQSALGDQASGLMSTAKSFVAGRLGMMSAFKSSACNICPAFGEALTQATGSSCVPHDDCLGVDCDVSINVIPLGGKLTVSLNVYPDQRKVTIKVNGRMEEITKEGQVTFTSKIKIVMVEVQVHFKVSAKWRGKEVTFSLSLAACVLSQCIPEIKLIKEIKLDGIARKRRSIEEIAGPFISNLESLSLEDVTKTFSDFSLPMEEITEQITGIQDEITNALKPNEDQAESTMTTEFKTPQDYKDKGTFPLKQENGELYVPFFVFKFMYTLGPLILRMGNFLIMSKDFDAGGAFGIAFDVKVQAVDSLLKTEIKPWVSGKFRASMSIFIVVASAGIDLTGWVMRTGFPLTLTTNYNKQPVVSRKALELELIPIELSLKGWVKILFIINIKKELWHYKADAIRTTIWEKKYKKEDQGPPRFPLCDKACSGRRKRSSGANCLVHQVKGRHPKDAAFKLEFSVEDKDSDLSLSYAVGDYPGGTNVQGWTTMRGNSLLSPAELPCGIPLHFLVKARNSQGLETTARCSIPTFDCTFPDGRVDAAHRCSSHPSNLKSQVILFDDSQLKSGKLFHGVGYSPSSFGHEVVHWQPLTLLNSVPQPGVSGDLRYFITPRQGRLTSTPGKSLQTATAAVCASACAKLTTCVTFVYNKYLQECELHEVTEGTNAERKDDSHYQTYERLGKSYTATLGYQNLPLRHGTKYYVNADVENVLGYRATLTSQGTMVDMTPPEPGPVGDVISDVITAGGCHASVIQRCEDHVANSLNHRKIVDGVGSRSVFTGNRKGQEMRFTMENYHAAANWDGFNDEECGLHGFTWSVGTTLCGTDVATFVDPHSSIHNPVDWTYTGLAKGLHLRDGDYYVTVQAVSDIIHGGDLVTTVCHSTPFTVDTTPPNFHAVQEFLFDDSFRYLVVYYNVSDHTSGVARMEFGLGKTKYDVMIRRYLPFEMRGVNRNTYIVNEEFETEDGIPAWIRLKVVNGVGLSATGAGEIPILLDSTPPVPGLVLDGAMLSKDLCCQMSTTQICAQWLDFHDPDTNIQSFFWGVGLKPGTDDVVGFHALTAYDKQSCVHVTLQHNVTYFSTVVANNKALNQKSANASSDGLLVDITPPIQGIVSDGRDVKHDINYTSETATVTASWADFYDPESGLADYTVAVMVNGDLQNTFTGISKSMTVFSDHSFSLQHGDIVFVELRASNRAKGIVVTPTDGMMVDHTPPELVDLGTENRTLYQQRDDVLHFVMEFDDPESGVDEYRCVVFQLFHGHKSKFWPEFSDFHPISLNTTSSTVQQLHLDGLSLQNGAAYDVKVTAMNRARIGATEESDSVTVDTTPPDVLEVLLARKGEEEETNGDGEVEHVDKEPLRVTWVPHDAESGIKTSHLCIGPDGSSDCLSSSHVLTVDGSSPPTVSFRDLNLQVSTDGRKVLYRVYMIIVNGASVQSTLAMSKPFLLLHANVAGVVSDGRDNDDVDFSHDKSSIAITFSGFSSQSCGIAGYEWGVGTAPFATDVLPYTDYGLVVDDAGNGFAQVHVMQFEGQTYYSSVRATTGHNCHEQYIVSSSDGFTVDTTPPTASFRVGSRLVTSQNVVYQVTSDHLDVMWQVQDSSGMNETQMLQDIYSSNTQMSRVPAVTEDPLALTAKLFLGDSIFPALIVTDNAGNEATLPFPPVTFDFTPPVVVDFKCNTVLSSLSPFLSCEWDTVNETQSALAGVLVGLGRGPAQANLMNMTAVPHHSRKWNCDVYDILGSKDITDFYVIMHVSNEAGLETKIHVKVNNDVTPPSVGGVIIVTSPRPGFHTMRQKCQTSQDYMEVLVTGMQDSESGINSVELALGSSPGQRDIKSFIKCRKMNGVYVLENLALTPSAIVHVTARITNTVGLYAIVTSEPVVVSPEPRLEVSDGPDESDRDGQSEVHVLEGRWRYSDPCPVLLAQWSVLELAGQPLTNFTHIPDTGNHFYNDALHLDNFKTYVNYVRIVDALNRTRTAYSDGVTVLISLPDTAIVRDGLGDNDIDFQQPADTLTANWDEFGDVRTTLPSDFITRYLAAVGTDRRFPNSRLDIHAFEDVGLNRSITFYGLNLTAKTQTYYVTVRAYSAAGSYVESSSDGIKVGFSGDVTAGQVDASAYQSSTDSLRFWWVGFDSDMVITHYYAGISSQPPAWDNDTHDCSVFLHNYTDLFDVRPLEVLAEESMAVLDNLSLEHGKSYYVTVAASDRMGHCSAAASGRVLVDTTPPVKGQVRAEGFNADTVIFVHSPQTLVVKLDDFPDPESGVQTVTLDLVTSASCSVDTDPDSVQLVRSVQAANQSVVFIRNLQLEERTLYFVRVTVRNGAGLDTRATSRPVLLDTTPPRPGLVKLGKDWTGAEQTFQPHTHTVSAVIAVQSVYRSTQYCVTQEDLLSPDTRHNWTSKEGEFSARSVGFDEAGLQVMVQHNPYLTGVDRGAAQFGPIAWREGTYNFRLSPASGDDIITGIALTSSTLQPPFARQNDLLPGNESSLPCSTSNGVCPEDRNQTLKPGHVGNSEDYGVGLTFLTREGGVRLLLWAQDALQLKHTWVPVDFDLAASTAHYSLTLTRGRGEVWEVSVGVNGQSKASVSGLVLSGPCVLTVYGWNVNDSFPPVLDPFRPFRAVTILRSLSLPLQPPPLCSHGNPFDDLTSDLAQVWVGISDSYNTTTTSNVANDTLVKSFCLPCLQQCGEICSGCRGEYLSDDFTLLPLTLRGLRLQAGDRVFANTSLRSNDSASSDNGNDTAWDDPAALNASKEEMSEFQLPTYYLHVRVVDHSGLETVVRSPGLVIDTSPPVIKSLYCFNPHFSKDVEIAFLGNNSTVGVTWEVSEDISDVTEVRVSLGSRPGVDDIIPKVTMDENQGQYIFTSLEPHLEEDKMYFITLQAENEAGLASEAWANFTVHTSPPDMTAYHVTMGNVTSVTVGDVTLGVTENTDQLELDLDVDPAIAQQVDVEYYELAIGTREGRDDAFPKTVVGLKGAKKVAIVNGFVHRDETPDQISVGDYTKKNISTEDLPDPTANLFNMEPGRCLTQRLYGVSKAHIATSFDVIPLCVKRRDDVMMTADNTTHVLQLNGSGLVIDAPHDDPDALKVSIKLKKGAVMAGVLSDSDMSEQYGSAASAEFSPFVVWPDPVVDPVSRWLKKRLVKIPGPNMYVSPVAEAEFADDLTVTYRVPATVLVPGDSTVSLLFWNADMKQWEAPEEVCSVDAQSYNNLTRTLTAKLCPGVFSSAELADITLSGGRGKRSTSQLYSTPPLQPRMLTLAVIWSSVPNLPPVVHNTTFTLLEDHGIYNFTLTYTDPEGDDMTFWLPQQPAHGTAKVTPEGKVTYIPAPNYSGVDSIHLKGREVVSKATQSLGVVPNEVSFTITVHITDTNDPPDIFYVPGQNNIEVRQEIAVGPTAGNGLNMTVYIEANTTTHAVLGLVVFSDVDLNDVITYTNTTHLEAGAHFEVNDVSSDDMRLADVNLTSATGTNGKEITINVTKGYAGHVTYDARVKDAAGTFSMQLTLNVFVLNNPCIHGDCQPRDPQGTCYEHQRAFTFDRYACHCDLGYEGAWCETETDECRTATCSPITDCVDLIGGYRCDVNTLKTVAIVVCCVLAVLLVGLAVFKLKKRPSKVDVWLDKPAKTFHNLGSNAHLSNMTPEQRDVSLPPMTSKAVHVTGKEDEEFEFMRQPLFTFRPSQNPTGLRPFVREDLLESDLGGSKAPAAKTQQAMPNKNTAPRVTAVPSTQGRLPVTRVQRQHNPDQSGPAKLSSLDKNTVTETEAHECKGIATIESLGEEVNAASSRCDGPASLNNEVDTMTSRPMSSSSNGRHSVYTKAGGEKELTKVEL